MTFQIICTFFEDEVKMDKKATNKNIGIPSAILQKLIIITITDEKLEPIQASHMVIKVLRNQKVIGYFKICDQKDGKPILDDINRKLAYESLAVYFGLESYIPKTQIAILRTKTHEWFGSFQEPSNGRNIFNVSSNERIRKLTKELHMSISKMRLFDTICHELDHSLNNYYPVEDEMQKYVTVSMFDNGSPGTFGLTISITDRTYYGCDPLFTQDGHFTIPYQDAQLIEKIRQAKLLDVYHILSPYLSLCSILFTWVRIKRIQRIIKKDTIKGNIKLLLPRQWSIEAINDELSGKYGNTYLYSLVYQWGGDKKPPNTMQ